MQVQVPLGTTLFIFVKFTLRENYLFRIFNAVKKEKLGISNFMTLPGSKIKEIG